MTGNGSSDGGALPTVAPLTGEEQQERMATEESRDALRKAWLALDEATGGRGCRNLSSHHHHTDAPESRGHGLAAAGPCDETFEGAATRAAPRVPCPGYAYGLRDLAETTGTDYQRGRLSLDRCGLWVWVRLDGCGAKEPPCDGCESPEADEETDPHDAARHWTSIQAAPLSILRRLAPEVGAFLAEARADMLARARKERGQNDEARAALPRPEEVPDGTG